MSSFNCDRFVFRTESESKHFICSICLDVFNNPIFTNCGHTFCKHCVQTLIENNSRNQTTQNCPECRVNFNRKRAAEDESTVGSVIISNYVFTRNLMAKSMVGELNIKCDYDFNGCLEVIKFDSIDSHLKQCQHKYCKDCGHELIAGRADEHNCLQLLKNDRNQLQKKLEERQQIISALTELGNNFLRNIAVFGKNTNISSFFVDNHLLLDRKTQSTIIGNFETESESFQIGSNYFRLLNVKPNSRSNRRHNSRYSTSIPFGEVLQIMFCTDPYLPSVAIKVVPFSCFLINEKQFGRNTDSETYKLDSHSTDPKHWYLIVVMKEEINRASDKEVYEMVFSVMRMNCRLIRPGIEISEIDSNSMKQLMENPVQTN